MATNARHTLIVVFLVGACGSNEDGSSGPCSQRSGTYRMMFAERSGNCGDMPEQVTTIDAQPTAPPPPCTSGEIRYSADNCEVTNINILCPEDAIAGGATSTTNAKFTWSPDGSTGRGVMSILLTDSSGVAICQSTYDAVATRL